MPPFVQKDFSKGRLFKERALYLQRHIRSDFSRFHGKTSEKNELYVRKAKRRSETNSVFMKQKL